MSRFTSTFKALALSMATALCFLVSSQVAAAQVYNESFKIHVPFSFEVGKRAMPAGEYRIVELNPALYSVVKTDGKRAASLTFFATSSNEPKEASTLVFHRYGDTYFLSQIWQRGNSIGAECPKSRGEKEVMQAKDDRGPVLVEVAMNTGLKH